MALYNIHEYRTTTPGHSQHKKKINGVRCDKDDNVWGIDMRRCVRMPRQNASHEERGKKDRNKFKKRRLIKPSKPEGDAMHTRLTLSNTLDSEYRREWSDNYVFEEYCKDETGPNWRCLLDPPPCV